MMTLYPKILGYLGALPFAALALCLVLFHHDAIASKMFSVFQLCYAALILCFLSGIHWPLAVRAGNNLQLSLSMLPTILSAALLFWGFTQDPLQPLLVMAALFWGQYFMDKKFVGLDDLPQGYLPFRLKLTAIVSALLVLSFFIAA